MPAAGRTARRPRRPVQDEEEPRSSRARDDEEGYDEDPEEQGEERTTSRRSASRPSRRAAPSRRDADDEDDRPRGRGRGSDDEDDEGSGGAGGDVQGGWGTWRQRKAETSGFADDFKVEYKEKYLIMFLDEAPFAAFNEHWIDEMPKGKKKSYVCIGKDCPLCEALGEKPKPRAMFNILEFISTDDGREAVHKVWTAGSGVVQEIEENADDPGLEGNYFRVSKSKSGRNGPTTYSVVPVKERDLEDDWNGMQPLSDDEYDEWFEKRYDKTYVKMPTRKSLKDLADEVLALTD